MNKSQRFRSGGTFILQDTFPFAIPFIHNPRLVAHRCLAAAALVISLLSSPAWAQSWSELSPVGGPVGAIVGQQPAGVGYDPTNNRLIVYFANGPQFSGQLPQVWVLTNANGSGGTPTWTQLAPSGTAPISTSQQSAVYDPTSNRLIVYGGCQFSCSPALSAVHVLSNANGIGSPVWSVSTVTNPQARVGQNAIYSAVNDTMTVFGGQLAFFGTDQNDTRILSNARGITSPSTWSTLPLATRPSVRTEHRAVYDEANNRMILFGGHNGISTCCPYVIVSLNDTWVLSSANGAGPAAWTQLSPSGTLPAPRSQHSAAYDPDSNRMIVYGGFKWNQTAQDMESLGDLWQLTNANGLGGQPEWRQIQASGMSPGLNRGHAAFYDSARRRMILFGGFGPDGLPHRRVWILDFTAQNTWDLKSDWSNTANPNGPWSYRGPTGNLLTFFPGWAASDFSVPPNAWAQQPGIATCWFQSTGNLVNGPMDYQIGDILTHSSSMVRWTSPINGTVQVTGGVWKAREFSRRSTWVLSRNGSQLATGSVFLGDPYSRNSPSPINIPALTVSTGDLLDLLIVYNDIGDYIGVTLTISAQTTGNNSPVAAADSARVSAGSTVSIPVLANDTDPDGDPLSITSVDQPALGTAVISGQAILYTPQTSASATDRFNYFISDGRSGVAMGSVTVNIGGANRAPVANGDSITVLRNTTTAVPVLLNDFDPDGDLLTITRAGDTRGQVQIPGDGTVRYTPPPNYVGNDSFYYEISDGQFLSSAGVSVTVISGGNPETNLPPTAQNDTATAVTGTALTISPLANDSDPNGDVLSLLAVGTAAHGTTVKKGNQVEYKSQAGYTGPDQFQYQISDGRGFTSSANVTITVTSAPTNRPPVVTSDNLRMPALSRVRISLLSNAYDPDGDPLTVLNVRKNTASDVAQLTVPPGQPPGVVDYERLFQFGASDVINFTVSDGRGGNTNSFVNVTYLSGRCAEAFNSAQASVTRGSWTYGRGSATQVVTIKNIGASKIRSPLRLVTNINSMALGIPIISGATNVDPNCHTQPYLMLTKELPLPHNFLAPGESTTIPIVVTNPLSSSFTGFSVSIVAGPGLP